MRLIMRGKVVFQDWIERKDLIESPDKLFVFGDNMARVGLGGQAAVMRGEPNAVGVPTKWSPGMSNKDFFSDADLPLILPVIEKDLEKIRKHLESGRDVVIPADGLGTGLSQLPKRAPKIFQLLEKSIRDLCQES
jgi:hypothetical protein